MKTNKPLANVRSVARLFAIGTACAICAAVHAGSVDTGGSTLTCDVVHPHSTDVYTCVFRAGEWAVVSLMGNGRSDLDLLIYDENGNLVASDVEYRDTGIVSWVPAWTGTFTIKVANLGSAFNDYCVSTN